ncbi:DUF1156 domain-containing protein [Kitasatospora griseola]|uniref:DUF1156 domain-containing protein n=1 Tax=Kitasatospora griseola TaxID=2064 RepID=UPI0036D7FA6F
MTRMIERWFPCAEVSANSNKGWGSGNQERSLFTWFAARPSVQAKAAVICSLLPWPDDEAEQKRLQDLVQEAMTGRYAAWEDLRREISSANPQGGSLLDPFSGRGMIPLEAARLGLPTFALDYLPVAALASELLIDYPFRNWDDEPELPFSGPAGQLYDGRPRLVRDVEATLREVGRRYTHDMSRFYPVVHAAKPWGYLWAVTLPCSECGRRFPLLGSLELKKAATSRSNTGRAGSTTLGTSLYIAPAASGDGFDVDVHAGPPRAAPTLANALDVNGKKIQGKSAICLFCGHVHPTSQHRGMSNDGLGVDALLAVVLEDKTIVPVTEKERAAATEAALQLRNEEPFCGGLSAIPDEGIAAGNGSVIQPSIYGAKTFGDLMCERQTLSFVRLCRIVDSIHHELIRHVSSEYARAIASYCAATIVRKLRYSTRGAWLRTRDRGSLEVAGIFINESSIAFSYDFFETACYRGAGSWESMAEGTVSALGGLMPDKPGRSASVSKGSATAMPYASSCVDVVVTDPPYDQMIAYADTSDVFFAWIRRALACARPELAITADLHNAQDKSEEIIVKKFRAKREGLTDHRTPEFYDSRMRQAFREMRRVVRDNGLVTIVFGHGEPEVWQRLLSSITQADLVMTGSWPANTESGGQKGAANIQTTLTMACRPAPQGRPPGRKGAVEAEVKSEIKRRYPHWERWGLAPADMLMAAAGPAMEVVGRYSEVLDARGEPVDISTFLPLARAAVQEAMAVEIDHQPLETFDARTRFALWWVRLYGRQVQAKSELRWQALASSLDLASIRDLVPEADKGVRFITSRECHGKVDDDAAVIDIALALAAASGEGLQAMGQVLVDAERAADDSYLWAAVQFLADRLPDNDPDSIAFTRVLRSRAGIVNAVEGIAVSNDEQSQQQKDADAQLRLI